MSRQPSQTRTVRSRTTDPMQRGSEQENPPAYREAVVTFLDILGFREIVSTRTAAEIVEMVRMVQRQAGRSDREDLDEFVDEDDDLPWTRTFAFSDSIIRARPIDARYSDGALHHEVLALVHAQAELALRGVFVRGGMSVGALYFEGDALFGPGLVGAYEFESVHANFPRVVIDPALIARLRSDRRLRAEHHDLADEIYYLRRLLCRSDDGLWFVDYLRAIEGELDEGHDYTEDVLAVHRGRVLEAARATRGFSRAHHKYMWLAEYHNVTCRNRFRDNLPEGLLITRDDLELFDELTDRSLHIGDED